jgi:putative sigma-54 modulation protein
MNIQIHPVQFDASSQLLEFIRKKLGKLDTFFDKIIDVEVFLKLENHEKIKDKVVEVKIHIPGKNLFAAEVAKTFEESTDLALDNISRQLKKHKEKSKESRSPAAVELIHIVGSGQAESAEE